MFLFHHALSETIRWVISSCCFPKWFITEDGERRRDREREGERNIEEERCREKMKERAKRQSNRDQEGVS